MLRELAGVVDGADRLRREGTTPARGISTVANGVAELPRACAASRSAPAATPGGSPTCSTCWSPSSWTATPRLAETAGCPGVFHR